MARQERIAGVVELDADRYALTGDRGVSRVVAVTMRDIQHPEGDPRRGAVRAHIAQAYRHERARPVDLQVELHDRCTQDLRAFVERRPVPRQRASVVLALVTRELGALATGPVRTPLPAGEAGGLGG